MDSMEAKWTTTCGGNDLISSASSYLQVLQPQVLFIYELISGPQLGLSGVVGMSVKLHDVEFKT